MPDDLIRALRTPRGAVAGAGAVLLTALVVLAPSIWGDTAEVTAVADRLAGPSAAHPLGTDELGRDLLARTLVAARPSVLLALGATAITLAAGIPLGIVAALAPRPVRFVAGGCIDILLSFPWLLLALFFSVIWGVGPTGAVLAVGLAGVPALARLACTMAVSVNGHDYVRAARVLGVGPAGVVWRHILPNMRPLLLVNTAVIAAVSLLSFTSLSFLGLGVQAPAYDWGRLLRQGAENIYGNPLAALGPGGAIVLAGLVLTFLAAPGDHAGVPRIHRRRPGRTGTGVTATGPVAQVEDLRISFPDRRGRPVERVRGISFTIAGGETVGLVGASGSGKSVTALALAGLLGDNGDIVATRLMVRDIDMRIAPDRATRGRLGLELAMVFQDPLAHLNPALTVGRQLAEIRQVHRGDSWRRARHRARDVLRVVGIDRPGRRIRQYPHELSGGMRQRVMIGMGLMGRPRLLIADEPTTALDATVQRTVMRVLHRARRDTGSAVLFISHDIALVSTFCDRILVMRDGLIVEELAADRLHEARHPYTRALIACVPHMATDRMRPLATIP